MASLEFTNVLRLAGSLEEVARRLELDGADVSGVDLDDPRAPLQLDEILTRSSRRAARVRNALLRERASASPLGTPAPQQAPTVRSDQTRTGLHRNGIRE